MFAFNYPHNFIELVWNEHWDHTIKHLQQKFDTAYKQAGSIGAMCKFWAELDGENREQLETWILANYKG